MFFSNKSRKFHKQIIQEVPAKMVGTLRCLRVRYTSAVCVRPHLVNCLSCARVGFASPSCADQSFFFFLACFLQFEPYLVAGVMHPDGCWQYLLPPCLLQVLRKPYISWVQPAIWHSPLPPPCLPQRPLRAEVVVQPATEHGLFFFPPPCAVQCSNPCAAGVVHPSTLHHPWAPCLVQRPRAWERVLQLSMSHTFVLPPPCLPHNPLD